MVPFICVFWDYCPFQHDDIIFHPMMFSFHLLHACYSDSYIISVFWNSSLTVASPIWLILQSKCLDPCLSPTNSKFFLFVFEGQHHLAITSLIKLIRMTIRQSFFPQNTLLFLFFGEDGWVIAGENKTECCGMVNCQNINLLPIISSSTCFLGRLLPFLLSSRHQI